MQPQGQVKTNNKILVDLIFALVILLAIAGAVVAFLLGRSQMEPATTLSSSANTSSSAPPDSSSVAFAAAGDFDVGENFSQTLNQIKANNTNFTLALGDFSYGNSTESQWCGKIHTTLSSVYPFELIVGNHDYINNSSMERFMECLPNRIPTMIGEYGRQYYFDYSSLMRVIAISPDMDYEGKKYTYDSGTDQYNWVSNHIDEARQSGIKWIVVAMHKNCLTMGVKNCEIGEDLQNLLVDKHVDLILQGHEHAYMRSKQLTTNLDCPKILSDYNESCVVQSSQDQTYQQGNGSMLVINGAGGITERDVDLTSSSASYFASVHAANTSPAYGPSIFNVSDSKIEAKFIDGSGQVLDSFTILAK